MTASHNARSHGLIPAMNSASRIQSSPPFGDQIHNSTTVIHNFPNNIADALKQGLDVLVCLLVFPFAIFLRHAREIILLIRPLKHTFTSLCHGVFVFAVGIWEQHTRVCKLLDFERMMHESSVTWVDLTLPCFVHARWLLS